jgi:hypothetical protein
MLRRADHLQRVSCPIAVDALPQAVAVEELAKAGAGDAEALDTHAEIVAAKSDLGSTPSLFEKKPQPHAYDEPADRASSRNRKESDARSGSDSPAQPERVPGGIQ